MEMSVPSPLPPFLGEPAAPAPWMPLDEALELWAMFGKDAPTALATQATSHAFAALAEERQALAVWNTSGSNPWEQAAQPSYLMTFSAQEEALSCLSAAALHWKDTLLCLQRHTVEEACHDASFQQDLCSLIGLVMQQRLRVCTIAQHLLAEQVLSHQAGARP